MSLLLFPIAYWIPRVVLRRWFGEDTFLAFAIPQAALCAVAYGIGLRKTSLRSWSATMVGAGAIVTIVATTPLYLAARGEAVDSIAALQRFVARFPVTMIESLRLSELTFFIGPVVAGVLAGVVTGLARDASRHRQPPPLATPR